MRNAQGYYLRLREVGGLSAEKRNRPRVSNASSWIDSQANHHASIVKKDTGVDFWRQTRTIPPTSYPP